MAGKIPAAFIEDLLARTNIVDVIEPRVPLRKKGREYVACCPFHHEKTPSFTVSPEKQFYHCFGCGAHGSAIGFLMEFDNLSFPEAVEVLAEQAGLEVPRERGAAPDRRQAELEPLYQALAAAADWFRAQLRSHPEAVDYLRRRGLSGAIARDFGIGFAPPGWQGLHDALARRFPAEVLRKAGLVSRNDQGRLYDRFRHRIMFPIRDRRGRVVAFGGRILDQGEPKYLNSPETPVFHKGELLYGLYEARQANRQLDELLVVEGYMDVVALAQHGLRNAVATLGTAVTEAHLRQLLRGVRRVVFCFDADRAGHAAAWRALEQALRVLRDGDEIDFLFLPEGEDPDSFVRAQGAEAFRARLAEAQPLSAYFLDNLKARHDTTTMEGRSRLMREAEQLLRPLQPGYLRSQLEEALRQLTGLSAAPAEPPPAPPSATPARSRRRRGLERTPMRVAIALLLQRPALARTLDPAVTQALTDLPGGELLHGLVQQLHANPGLTTAQLLETHRDGPHARALHGLAVWQPLGEQGFDWAEELQGAIDRLHRQRRQRRIEALLQRAREGELLPEEKDELRRLQAQG